MTTYPFTSLLLICLGAASFATAQEAVPLDKAQDAARKVNASLGRIDDVPFSVDADTNKPQAIHADKVGIMILPDKHFTSETLAASFKDILPVGQLWMLSAAVADGSKAPAKDKLRSIAIEEGDKEKEVQLYLLGVRKTEGTELELVIFGKGKEPITHIPLKATSGTQEFPLQLTGRKESDTSGILTVQFLGQYTADVRLVKSE